MKVITSERIPIKLWLDDIEDSALQQAKDLANLPFAQKWIAIMPDSHVGYGMPIGGVLATKGAIIPNAVGVDIGCGMAAVKTSLKELDIDTLKKIMSDIRKVIPVGFNHRKTKLDSILFNCFPDISIVQKELESAKYQLGTLGGGNHFIEIQKGSDGFIYIMIHSGSRNFGLKIANEYHKKAVILCEKYHSNIPNKDLSFLPDDSREGVEYFQAMHCALTFAKHNRLLMMINIQNCFRNHIEDTEFEDILEIHHNYVDLENHFGKNYWIHRKGATSARKDQLGIIPGSQGTNSYIVSGLGNEESFCSCSHGAGRKLGRKAAQRELNLDVEKKFLEDQGIVHSVRNASDLDEASGAYKDIENVMANQSDLVKILIKLKPLGVIKG